jgi:stage II sporulation protein AA (anti-sigma F factor antagonist)
MLTIAEREDGAKLCELRLEGELEMGSAQRLGVVLKRVAESYEVVLVGLEECEFVDSTGIAVFLHAQRRLEDRGGRLLLHGPSSQVRRIFEIAGLLDAGLIFDTREDALAELR